MWFYFLINSLEIVPSVFLHPIDFASAIKQWWFDAKTAVFSFDYSND
jgi:hypothetical protein